MSAGTLFGSASAHEPLARTAPIIGAVSGKGGVGKTNLVANLAVAAAGLGRRVLLVDGDLGLANVDVLLGLVSTHDIADLLADRCTLEEALIEGPRGVQVLTATAGRSDLAALDPASLARLRQLLREAALDYDLVLVDVGAGVGPSVVGLADACDPVLVVTTSEPTSLADAYAAIKVLCQSTAPRELRLIVNAAPDETEARRTHALLERVTRRFLDVELCFGGYLPQDARLAQAVAQQRAVVEAFPTAICSRRIVALAAELLKSWPLRAAPEPASREPASREP